MEKIVTLLMNRDGLSFEEARSLVLEARRTIRKAAQDGFWEDAEIILVEKDQKRRFFGLFKRFFL